MAILLTGASGFVGGALMARLASEGHTVYGLSRHPPEAGPGIIPLLGDITADNLGLAEVPPDIVAVYHVAGIHNLGEDKDGSIWNTNVRGTDNVIEFCGRHNIRHLVFTSTAYTWHCNAYGLSKIRNEAMLGRLNDRFGMKVSIFKPSVIMGTAQRPYPGHFSQFIRILVKLHRGAEVARRSVEEALSLPILEPVFRVRGNPEAHLNLVSIDDVVNGIVEIARPGTFFLTNPEPPTLGQLVEWVGEYIKVNLKIMPDFKPNILEKQFEKLGASFLPYLQGDSFPSDIKCQDKIDRLFIEETVKRTLTS